jgi:hypothetical protein
MTRNSGKILGLAAALLLSTVAVGGLWAQDLKFDGYINSGLGFAVNDKEGDDAFFKAFAADAEQNGYRFRLNGSYTNEAKNAGARFRFQAQSTLSNGNTAGYFSLPYVYGWVSFLKQDNYDIITLNSGIIEDSTWQTGDWWLGPDSVHPYTGLGALLKLTPIEGLNLGVGSYLINRLGGGNNNFLAIDNLGTILKPWDVKYTAHGGYTMKDVFRVGLSFRSENRASDNKKTTISNDQSSRIFGEFRYLGLKDLTAVVATSIDNIGEGFEGKDFATKGNIIISETFGYKIDDLSFGLNAVEFLYNKTDNDGEKVEMNPGLLFNLWGSYAFDTIVPRLDLVYFAGGRSNLVTTNQWHRRGFTPSATAKNADN